MIVKLNNSRIVRLGNTEPFIVPENLILEFESAYRLDKLSIVAKQNDKTLKFVSYDKKVDLSEFTKQAGVIEICVSLICNGKVAKVWELEPLIVLEIDGEFQIMEYYNNLEESQIKPLATALDAIKSDLSMVKEKTNEFILKHNELAQTVRDIKENY